MPAGTFDGAADGLDTEALFGPETDGDLPLPEGEEPADGLLLDDDGFMLSIFGLGPGFFFCCC